MRNSRTDLREAPGETPGVYSLSKLANTPCGSLHSVYDQIVAISAKGIDDRAQHTEEKWAVAIGCNRDIPIIPFNQSHGYSLGSVYRAKVDGVPLSRFETPATDA